MNFVKEARGYQQAMPPTNVKDHTMGFALGMLEAKCIADFTRMRFPSGNVIEEIKKMLRNRILDISDKIDEELGI